MSPISIDLPPRSLDELLACQAEVARRLSGAGRSCWNGQVTGLPRPGDPVDLLGVADWDGTLRFSRREVLAPLRELLSGPARPGRHALRRYKEALLAVFHENNHLLAPAGEEHDRALDGWDWATVVMEEGVTEAFTSLHIGEFIRALRLDRIAPGLADVEVPTAYPEYVPVVVALVERVARTSRLGPGEVMRQLNAQNAPGKYRRLCQLSLAWLGDALPPDELGRWERRLERSLRDVLGRSRIFPLVKRGRIPGIAAALAEEAVRVLDQHMVGLPAPGQGDGASLPALR